MTSGFYLKAPGRATVPGGLVSVVVSTRYPRGQRGSDTTRPRVCGRVSVWATRWNHGRWTFPENQVIGDADTFWRWIHEWADPERRTWVVAPVASDAVTLLSLWPRFDLAGARWHHHPGAVPEGRGGTGRVGEYRLRKLVLRGQPDIIEYSVHGRSYLWVSGRQFFPISEDELAGLIGYQWPSDRGREPGSILSGRPDHERAEMWLRAFQFLGDWWRGVGAGPFPRTVPAMSMQFLRSRMQRKCLSTHQWEDALKLERRACHGGRASTWFFGDVLSRRDQAERPRELPTGNPHGQLRGPLVHFDVRSMYPTLLRDQDYPVHLFSHRTTYTVRDLVELQDQFGIVASVRLDTERPEYPHRSGDRVTFPVGQFTSVLCGPELRRALADGIVTRVNSASVYHLGKPYQEAAAELLEMRAAAKRTGNPHWELFVKLLSNALAGKLAQRTGRWVEDTSIGARVPWGEWIEVDADSGVSTRFRALSGLAFRYDRSDMGVGTLMAGYAFLTSYGRYRMRQLRELLPARSVVSQDTDGLWCTRRAVEVIRNTSNLVGSEPGQLRETARTNWGRWWGPKHYLTADGWTLAGVHTPPRPHDGTTWTERTSFNPVRSGATEAPVSILEVIRDCSLSLLPAGGTVGGNGWLNPTRLPTPTRAPDQLPDEPPPPLPWEEPPIPAS